MVHVLILETSGFTHKIWVILPHRVSVAPYFGRLMRTVFNTVRISIIGGYIMALACPTD